jgi:hypothetical protein
MKNCSVTFEEIIEHYEERGDASTQARVLRHLENGCAQCRERLTWLQQFLPALHDVITKESIPAPETALALARQIARDRLPVPPLAEPGEPDGILQLPAARMGSDRSARERLETKRRSNST